uniref:Uncharacterized protein n=1 Tax=Arundo donax TaxID=35708 RepID=A0A0A8ZL07_ARUDO
MSMIMLFSALQDSVICHFL